MTEPSVPYQSSAESLNKLSENFRPANVKYLLALDSQYTLQDCMERAEGMVQRLKRFVENGNSTEGTDLPYVSVKRYKPSQK